MYIDCHSHRPVSGPDTVTVVSFRPAELPAGHGLYTAGIHPWDTGNCNGATELERLNRAAAAGRLVAVGECGLDRLRGAPLPEQETIFRSQLEIAAEYGLPVIIHCVRCYPELLRIRKDFPSQRWLIHGCNARPDIIDRLLKAACYLSFGPAVLSAGPLRQTVAAVPDDRLMLETDDSGSNIKQLYDTVAALRQIDPAVLEQQLKLNFTAFFGKNADEYD